MDTNTDLSQNSDTNPIRLDLQSPLTPNPDPSNQTHHHDQDQTAENEFEENYNEALHEELQKKVSLNVQEEEREWDGWDDVIVAEEGYRSAENYGGENGRSEMENEEVGFGKVSEFSYGNGNNRKYNSNYNNYNYQNNQEQYPVRPEADDCAFYMKTGTCKFGSNCRFNHPLRRKYPVAKEKVKEEEATDNTGQTECKYYLRTGGCKYGKDCRYNHSKAKTPAPSANTPTYPVSELNFLGLPIRLGEKECPYYMRNGSCKYGCNCKFNHPDPISVGGSDPPPALGNGGSTTLHNASRSRTSWSSTRAIHEPAPFVPVVFPPTQRVPPHNIEWNGYQPPVFPPDRGIRPPPTYLLNNPMTDGNAFAHQHQQIVDEFPERPGQPECTYFMKTGDCKFKSNCKFHHPKSRVSKPLPCALSDKGLPLRPDQNICSHYSRYGICKFGPACKFNHPEEVAPSSGFSDNRMADFDETDHKEEASVSEYGNGNAPAIQQSV